MRKKKTSMQDIADYLQISKNAVSLALSHKPGVGEELRERVIKAAKELHYGGYGEPSHTSNHILVIKPEHIQNERTFYYDIYWAVEKEAQREGYHVTSTCIYKAMEDGLILPVVMKDIAFAGMIVVGVMKKSYILALTKLGLPMVLIDEYYEDIPIDAVVTANMEGAFSIVQHLIEKGHKDIGIISPIYGSSSFYDRWVGYKKAMEVHGLKVLDQYNIIPKVHSSFEKEEELEPFLANISEYPTAWFCANDRIAINLISLLNKNKVQIPEQVSVVGFDDIEAAGLMAPSLTTIRVQRDLMGSKAVSTLVHSIRQPREHTISKIHMYGELICRDSVKDCTKGDLHL